jgi:hypothetical protein
VSLPYIPWHLISDGVAQYAANDCLYGREYQGVSPLKVDTPLLNMSLSWKPTDGTNFLRRLQGLAIAGLAIVNGSSFPFWRAQPWRKARFPWQSPGFWGRTTKRSISPPPDCDKFLGWSWDTCSMRGWVQRDPFRALESSPASYAQGASSHSP